MEFCPAVYLEQVGGKTDEFGAAPVVRHVSAIALRDILRIMLFPPCVQGACMIGKGIQGVNCLVRRTVPKPCMTVETGKVTPYTVDVPARSHHHSVLKRGVHHLQRPLLHRISFFKDLSWIYALAESPLGPLREASVLGIDKVVEVFVTEIVLVEIPVCSGHEGGDEIIVFRLPTVCIFLLRQSSGSTDHGLQAAEAPYGI